MYIVKYNNYSAFNHNLSNVGYIILGVVFLINVGIRQVATSACLSMYIIHVFCRHLIHTRCSRCCNHSHGNDGNGYGDNDNKIYWVCDCYVIILALWSMHCFFSRLECHSSMVSTMQWVINYEHS